MAEQQENHGEGQLDVYTKQECPFLTTNLMLLPPLRAKATPLLGADDTEQIVEGARAVGLGALLAPACKPRDRGASLTETRSLAVRWHRSDPRPWAAVMIQYAGPRDVPRLAPRTVSTPPLPALVVAGVGTRPPAVAATPRRA